MLVFLLFFQSFGLGVSASDSENLIDSDLRNWEIIYPDYTTVLYKRDNEFLIRVKPFTSESNPNVKLTIGGVYHLTDLVNGNSYTLNFKYLNPSQMGVGEALANAPYLNGAVAIGLASKTGDKYELIENACITINKDNYLDYYGNNFSINFKMENIINPCIIFYYMGSGMGYEIYFGVGDVSLIDNDAAKEDNFFSRLFAWFQDKFDAIGESFTNLGNKLTDLKNSFVNKITDLKDSFVLKLEELKQGILNLGDIIIEGIQGLFMPDEAYIIQWKANLQQLLQDNLGIIYTCGDLFITIIQEAFSIISDAPDTYEIKIPEVSFEANGTRVPVFTSQTIDFSFMEKPVFRTMYSMYTVALYIFFGGLEVRYALRVKNKVMSN